MTRSHIKYCLPALLLAATSATAQDLSTEVVVERTIVPAERAATRPAGLTPTLVLPAAKGASLEIDNYTGITTITRSFSPLSPARAAMAAEKSPYRGWIDAGYFPAVNAGISAGYRLVDTRSLSLDAAVLFNGERYKPSQDKEHDDYVMQSWNGVAALGLGWTPDSLSALNAGARFDFLRRGCGYWEPFGTTSGRVGADWTSKAGIIDYNVGVTADFEKSGDARFYLTEVNRPSLYQGLAQQKYGAAAGASTAVGEGMRAGLDLGADILHTGAAPTAEPATTMSVISVEPFYGITTPTLSATVGIKVDIAGGGEGSKVSAAPDINAQWTPSAVLGVSANITGGQCVNSFADMRQYSVYQIFTTAYQRSRIPVRADLSINFGPFSGFSGRIFGGYAKADRWLMAHDGVLGSYSAHDISGWQIGLGAAYTWRWLEADASAALAPSDYQKAWIDSRDRAKCVVSASVTARPIDPLSIRASYELRSGRKAFDGHNQALDLGSVSDLSLTASWQFTPAFTVFARAENLLGHRYMPVAWELSQKQHGLVGVAFKF